MGVSVFSQIASDQRTWPQTLPREVQVGPQGEFLHGNGCQVLEWMAQGGGGISITGGVKKKNWMWYPVPWSH